MRIAADGLAAVAVVGQELRLVADADLPHLDPRLKIARQGFDEVAKVDAVLGEVEKDDPFAAEDVLDVDQFHLQPALSDELDAFVEGDAFHEALVCAAALAGVVSARDAAIHGD